MPRIPAVTAPPPLPPLSQPSLPTAHSLLVLSEYTHTLDSLPLDLSRQFADLRELDAVLSASTTSVTQKIYELIDLIENPAVPRDERLTKLGEIAEEAQRLKLGGEDKIRVASQAAESLLSHQAHLSTLLSSIVQHDTSFTPSHLYLRTTYPHIPPRPAQDIVPLEGGRRRRAAAGRGQLGGQLGGMLAVESLSPAKGRKRVREEEEPQSVPRRERENNSTTVHKRSGGGGGAGAGAKARKVENPTHSHAHTHRAVSPSAESVVSITSHPVGQPLPTASRTPAAPIPPAPQPAPRVAQQAVAPAPPVDDGEGADDGEHDGGRYCYCQGPSYGEMVGCDDDNCAFEWFHLNCIGLTTAPKGGTWYCDDCKAKRAGNKKSRNNKRRTGGGAGGVGGGGGTNAPASGARGGRGRA